MYRRLNSLINSNSFFLFGARGTGKSTLIRDHLKNERFLEIDLLDPVQAEEAMFALGELKAKIDFAVAEKRWVFIDEVQKVPKILDVVQSCIDRSKGKFVLSGSSARKLKRGAANLLAGRAYTFRLYPLTSLELGAVFDLDQHLRFGGLPHVWNTHDITERVLFLRSYVTTYLKEEIAEEQIVRKLEPFSRFLQVAAQASGHLLNYTNIAKDVGVSDQTVKTYFQILEETLLGFTLPAYNRSVRKSIGKTPKFYFFDTGVLRALQRNIDQQFDRNHYAYGLLFEHFVIQECMRLADYYQRDFEFSFLRINEHEEVDLIIDRGNLPEVLIEIKSTYKITERHSEVLQKVAANFPNADLMVLSNDPESKLYGRVKCLHWQAGIAAVLRA
jgi:uncharacterized protein